MKRCLFKVYIKPAKSKDYRMNLMINAMTHAEARLGAQMVMRKRFGQEIFRDYTITKAVKVKI